MENPEFVNLLVKFFGVMVGVFWFLCFCNGLFNKKVKPLKIPDRFDIGYIDDPLHQQVVVVKQQTSTPKKKNRIQLDSKQEDVIHDSNIDNAFLNDCIGTLINLGTKRREAQLIASQFLSANPHVNTIEQFILGVYKRES